MGRDGTHLKLLLWGEKRGFDAIAFRQGEKLALADGRVDVVFNLERNWYQGIASLQLNVQDLRPAQG